METIDDIVKDIREQNLGMPDDMECVSPLVCDMLRLADRIEKAAKHEMSDEFSAEIQKLTDELYEVKKANIRLKAALQPVLDIAPVSFESHMFNGGCWRSANYDGKVCTAAVIEAQRIWKEVEK